MDNNKKSYCGLCCRELKAGERVICDACRTCDRCGDPLPRGRETLCGACIKVMERGSDHASDRKAAA